MPNLTPPDVMIFSTIPHNVVFGFSVIVLNADRHD